MRLNFVRSVADKFASRKPARRRPIQHVRLAVEHLEPRLALSTVQFGSGLYDLVTDTNVKTEPVVAKPGYLNSYIDPLFGTKVTRITGNVGAAIPNIPGSTWGNISRAGYETRPAWNAVGSILLLEKGDPAHTNLFLDGNTYQPLFEKTPPGNEFRWDPAQANMMVYVGNGSASNTTEFGRWNVMTSVKTVQLTISGYTNCDMEGDGNWSSDGNMVAVYGTRVSDNKSVVFAVNLSTGTKYPDIDVAAQGMNVNDGVVSISPKGDLIVINGTVGANSDYTRVFDLQGNTVVSFTQYGLPSHFDLSVDANGNQVAVGVAKTASPGAPAGTVVMRNLQTGAITALNQGGYASLVSTRNQSLPGWAFVNDVGLDQPNNYPPYNDEVYAVKLDGSKTVVRLASTHSHYVDYENQGFVVPSPDGLRFVFSSDWGDISGRPVQTYVVDLRGLHLGYDLRADGTVWQGSTQLDSGVKSISVTSSNTLYELKTSGSLRQYNGSWTNLDTSVQSMAFGSTGIYADTLYYLKASGDVWRYETNGVKTFIDNSVQSIAVASSKFYGLKTSGALWSYDASMWRNVANGVQSIAGIQSSSLFLLQGTNVFRDNGSSLTMIDSNVQSIVMASDNKLCELKTSGALWTWDTVFGGWDYLDGGVGSITLLPDGRTLQGTYTAGGTEKYSV